MAARYEGTGATRKLAPRSKEELEKLRRIVQGALGVVTGSEGVGKDEIALEEMPFNDPYGEVAQDLSKQAKKQFWWTQAQTLIYPGLALAVLVVFWRLLKRTPVEQISSDFALEDLAVETGQGAGNSTANRNSGSGQPQPMRKRQVTPGLVTAEIFSQLVRENPDNMTQAIQTWLGGNKKN